MTYFGGNGHRPRLVSLGIIFSGISSLLIVIPHFVYGKSTPQLNGKCPHFPTYATDKHKVVPREIEGNAWTYLQICWSQADVSHRLALIVVLNAGNDLLDDCVNERRVRFVADKQRTD
jgi:hypothetical protein